MPIKSKFSDTFQLKAPIIVAPMFLVSNEAMVESAITAGVMGTFPTLNYREDGELDAVLQQLNKFKEGKEHGSYGVNLIVQRTNIYLEKHLAACVKNKVPFYITSLGNPKDVIAAAHSYGAKVFCDVTNLKHAEKCASLGADGFIAVGQGAGGHAGPYPLHMLLPQLREAFPHMMLAGAGGMSSGTAIASAMISGADSVSIGTRFIATPEAGVSDEYKQAIVDATMDDIVLSEKISGTPCTIINTPYAKKIGYKQSWFERLMSKNKTIRKYFKMIVQYRGFKNLEASVKPGSYKTLWVAGQSVAHVDKIQPLGEVVQELITDTEKALNHKMGE